MKTKKALKKLPVYLLLGVALIVALYPLFWIIMTSLKPAAEQFTSAPYALPRAPTLDNYASLGPTILLYFKNSAIVVVITLVFIVFFGTLAAYPLAKMEFKGRKLIKNLFMVGVMIPVFVSLVPMFSIYNAVGLKNTYLSLIIPQVGFSLPMAMYLMVGFLDGVPDSLIEAGYIDGAGSFRIFFQIILPLMKNVIVTVAIFNFVFVWNEFIFANTFISDAAMKTVPVGLNDFVNNYGMRDWGSTFAAVTATVLPTLAAFFFLNKQVMEGMTAGAVKS